MRPFEIDWWPKRVISGAGSVAHLPAQIEAMGKTRVVLLCGRSIKSSSAAAKVEKVLGKSLVGVFPELEMHAPIPVLERAVDYVRSVGGDVLISLGGGSAIDSVKGVRLLEQVGSDFDCHALKSGEAGRREDIAMPPIRLPQIAIPTTTGSGSELTPTCGLRDPSSGHKLIFRNERLIPELAILDPEMAVEASPSLTAYSSMTAVARSVEALYGGRRSPFRSALSLQALSLLTRSLTRSVERPDDLEARADCLVGSALSAIAANVNTSAVHAIGHILGGRYKLQHGAPHAMLLPSAMRIMLPSIGNEQKAVLFALGASPEGLAPDEAGRRAATIMQALVASLPIPKRLSDVKIAQTDLPEIAAQASRDPIFLRSGADLSGEQILDLLQSAY